MIFVLSSSVVLPSAIKPYEVVVLATNGLQKVAYVTGDRFRFLADFPGVIEGDNWDDYSEWTQLTFPYAPGANPFEKYRNGLEGIGTVPNPDWDGLARAAAQHPVYYKLLSTQNNNIWSAFLTNLMMFHDLVTFQGAAMGVIAGLPEPLTEDEKQQLNALLSAHSFPFEV